MQRALDSAALTLPDVDALAPRMLGIDEHRYRSVRFFRDPATKAWKRDEPWMTTIVDLDTRQVLGIVDGRDSEGVGDWLFARPLEWRLGVARSTRQRRSARRCGCGCHAPLSRSTHLTWSSSATTCSPRFGSASPSRSMADGDAPSTRQQLNGWVRS